MTNDEGTQEFLARMHEDDDALYSAILERTRRHIRWQRRRRWATKAAIPLMAFALGYLARGVETSSVPTSTRAHVAIDTHLDASAPLPNGTSDQAAEVEAEPIDPLDLEIRARLAEGADRCRLLRVAGDAWLRSSGDLAAAARCYAEHLTLGGSETQQTTDSWLLLRLKANSGT